MNKFIENISFLFVSNISHTIKSLGSVKRRSCRQKPNKLCQWNRWSSLSTRLQSTTSPSSFFNIQSSQIRVLRPLPSRNG